MKKAEVNLLANSMVVDYDDSVVSEQGIIDAVVHVGYGASSAEDNSSGVKESSQKVRGSAAKEAEKSVRSMRNRVILSFCFLIPLMYLSMHHMLNEWIGLPVPGFMKLAFHGPENAITFAMAQLILVLPIMYINRKYYQNGFKALFHLSPNMDTLIAVGSSAAVVYGVYSIFYMGIWKRFPP